MKRLSILGTLTISTLALSGIAAPASYAVPCWRVANAGEGLYKNVNCNAIGPPFSYIPGTLSQKLKAGEWCLKARTAGTGVYKEPNCTKEEAERNYAKISATEPCLQVAVAKTGVWDEEACAQKGKNLKEYVRVVMPAGDALRPAKNVACVHVSEPATGTYKTEEGCAEGTESEASGGEYIKVIYSNPFISTSGTSKLRDPSEATTLTCSTGAGQGDVASGDTLDNIVVRFTGCRLTNTGGTCTIKSATTTKEGEIITTELKGLFGSVAKTEATSEVGLLIEPKTGHTLAILGTTGSPCNTLETAVEGSIAGEATPVKTSQTTAKVAFAPVSATGKQKIKLISVLSGLVKPKLTSFGAAESTEELTEELTFEEAFEIT